MTSRSFGWLFATGFAVVVFGLSAWAAPPALADCSPFVSGAVLEGDHVRIDSVGFSGGIVGFTFDAPPTFADLTQLSVEYSLPNDRTGGGSPRITAALDLDGDTFVDGYLHVYLGAPPQFSDPPNGTFVSTGNLMGSADRRFDLQQFGGPFYGSYAEALDLVGFATVRWIGAIGDGGWFQPDNTQTVLFRSLRINDGIEACVFPPPPAPLTLSAAPARVRRGGRTTVQWTAPAGSSARDVIGLARVGRATLLNSFVTGGARSGSRTIKLQVPPGSYEFRYYPRRRLGTAPLPAVSNRITVTP